jgi:hypothetical protein
MLVEVKGHPPLRVGGCEVPWCVHGRVYANAVVCMRLIAYGLPVKVQFSHSFLNLVSLYFIPHLKSTFVFKNPNYYVRNLPSLCFHIGLKKGPHKLSSTGLALSYSLTDTNKICPCFCTSIFENCIPCYSRKQGSSFQCFEKVHHFILCLQLCTHLLNLL